MPLRCRAPDHQVLLAAFAAERQRQQDVPVGLRLHDLVVPGDPPADLVLQGHVGGVALGQELVQPEREQRPAGTRVPGADPACRVRCSAFSHCAPSVPVCSASSAAAAWTVTGLRRARLPSSSRSRPKVVSIQEASGSRDQVAVADGGGGRVDPPRGDRPGVLVGGADQGLPDHALGVAPAVPKMSVATRATTVRRCALVPSVDMVAEVPTHCTPGAAQASFTRRMSSATSAPCRPR